MKGIIYDLQPNSTIFSENINYIKGYTDADQVDDTNTRRSISDYIFLDVEKLVVWGSNK